MSLYFLSFDVGRINFLLLFPQGIEKCYSALADFICLGYTHLKAAYLLVMSFHFNLSQALVSLPRIIYHNLCSLYSSLLCKDVKNLFSCLQLSFIIYFLFLKESFCTNLKFQLFVNHLHLQEYKSITKMRLNHIDGSPPKPSHFTVLVRAIPWHPDESYSDSVEKFFQDYHASGYLSHQMVQRSGTVQKLMVRIFLKLLMIEM